MAFWTDVSHYDVVESLLNLNEEVSIIPSSISEYIHDQGKDSF